MLTINVVTLFPQLFNTHISEMPFKKAINGSKLQVIFNNPRDFAVDSHKTVDDKPFGGGVGMVLMLEPLYKTLHSIYSPDIAISTLESDKLIRVQPTAKQKIIVLSPHGEKFTQTKAYELAEYEQITLVCGRYEGIDARLSEVADVEYASIGEYVLSGGELPALVIMESITRLLPGVLEKPEAIKLESFSSYESKEHPQYTRPENFKGIKVPSVLLSGDHKKIQEWKEQNAN